MNSQSNNKKRFYIHTLGCKVNQYESQAMRESLIDAGFEECASKDMADVFVLNTCTVTEKADKESRYMVNAFRRANPEAKIVVTGCYVEKDSAEVAALPGVAHIVKNSEKNRLADILNSAPPTKISAQLRITGFKDHTKAFIKIQDGCENACAYCKVPLVRGSLWSRPLNAILDEVEGLVGNGFREIVLTGICLGAWGVSGTGLADVLRALDDIHGDFRIRLSSIEPKYVTDDIIAIIKRNRKICRHLHIPLQSGDDEILKSMNRPYDTAAYRSLVEKARAEIDGLAITTDVMVGFPGESAAHFKNTLDFVRQLSPARTHIFTFSRRPGTTAYSMEGGIDPYVAKKRHCELEGPALNAAYLFAKSFVGDVAKVLVENKREADSGLLTGYSDNYIKMLFSGPDVLMGQIVPVRITEAGLATTMGVYEE
jgi:threonylcarbamoyladenosine tRNA methylthiotransferase MtaB